jgi:hypothetical protein
MKMHPQLTLLCLYAFLSTSCIVTSLDRTETSIKQAWEWRDYETKRLQFGPIQQLGHEVRGSLEQVVVQQYMEVAVTRIRTPTMYASSSDKGLSPARASALYWMFLPITGLMSIVNGTSGFDPVEWDEEEVEAVVADKNKFDEVQRPASGVSIQFSLLLPGSEESIAGNFTTDIQGLWSLDLAEFRSVIRKDLDLGNTGTLHLSATIKDAEATGNLVIDLVKVLAE